jgi:LysM repeat protein
MFYCPLVHLLVHMFRVQHLQKERISMGSKQFLRFSAFVLAAVLLIFSLAACTLSASEGISGDSETTGDFPVPEDENMGLFDIAATQTAAAALPAVVEPTPLVVFTATPLPQVVPTATSVPVELPKPTEGKPPATYTLQKGEFPFCIARRFNVNQTELLTINGLGLSSQVQPGTTLKIPQTGNPFVTERALTKHPAQYTVAAGDTFYSIACKFGDVGPDLIALANNKSVTDSLSAGEKIQIP